MKITDINGKERDITSIKKVTQQIPDSVNGGVAAVKEYVEVMIIGKTRTWKEWYPIEEFRDMNPKVVI